MQELMLSLLLWLGANTDFNNKVELPKIEYRDFAELYKMGYKKHATNPNLPRVWAIYDDSVVYLHLWFDLQNVQDQSRLLHELVHHLQVKDGRLYRCDSMMEPEAHRIQKQWLEARSEYYFGPSEKDLALEYFCGPNESEEIEAKYG